MKFVRPTDTNDTGSDAHITQKADMAIRYADILLMYAEAVNELQEGASYSVPSWDGKATYTIMRTVDELKKGIQPVRIRAGIPDYSEDVYNSRDLFRAKLKRERQIELMGEGQRYFDLRRWLDADAEESLPVYGCNVEMDQSNRDLFHTPVRIESIQSRFLEKTYFWPIQIDELYRNRRPRTRDGRA